MMVGPRNRSGNGSGNGFRERIPNFDTSIAKPPSECLGFDLGSTARCRSFSLHSALETFEKLSAIRRPVLTSGEREPVGYRHSRSSRLGCHGLGLDEADLKGAQPSLG